MCCFSITRSAADLRHTSLDMVNLEPLRTVKNYLLAYGYGNISLRLVVLNLAGNLIAFAPMGVFLPALFRWQRSIFFFTASLTLSITAVEVLQVYTGTGSCDVDDLILNLAGALLVFVICRITPLVAPDLQCQSKTKEMMK